ncbi:hypothetical protein ACIQ6K_15730 [Streptomyces sp. NPDC096354]|uniref:hypothetical protein n=1 Tax=Streptomyces sp. NPDC096354 TaxID=3366088 RepID=UPI0038282FA9
MTVDVDLPAHIRARCTELGDGALYAVKTLARQLADDPCLGERAGRLGAVPTTRPTALHDRRPGPTQSDSASRTAASA